MPDFRINICREDETPVTGKVTEEKSKVTPLVRKAIGGDTEAFGELYSVFAVRIYRYVFYQVRNKMIAEDLTEEVFVKAWRAIDSCRGKETTFSPWLFRIAHNHVIDSLRRSRNNSSVEVENLPERSDPTTRAEGELERHELIKLVARLPEKQRQVVILKFIEGLDNHEISRILGKGEGAIRILQMRALSLLREWLTEE